MNLQKIKKNKLIKSIAGKLPSDTKEEIRDIRRWWRYVFYRRFFQKKLLGLFPVLNYFFFKSFKKEIRILGIWNFASTPPSIGVFLEFQMRLMCMSCENNNCKIDIAIIYDPNKVVVGPKYDFWINSTNFHYHFGEMYPMLHIMPNLGSIYLFDSHDEFEKFYLTKEDQYIMHPNFFAYVNNSDSRPNIPYVRDFYLKEGFIPKFEFKPSTVNWARAFIKKHVGDNYAVVVSLRNNNTYTSARNSSLDEWAEFFKYCSDKKYNITFIILARENEAARVKEGLKDFSNIVYSADENANIEQNLALMELSFMYMATIFGPASFPLLTNYIPFILTNYDNPEKHYDYKWLKKGGHFPWNNLEIQKLVWEHETADVLITEFEKIFPKINKEDWKKRVDIDSVEEEKLRWPYN